MFGGDSYLRGLYMTTMETIVGNFSTCDGLVREGMSGGQSGRTNKGVGEGEMKYSSPCRAYYQEFGNPKNKYYSYTLGRDGKPSTKVIGEGNIR